MKPLHYEIHVTVKTEEVNRFIEECGAIGVKPIVLDLQKQDGGSIQDVMTSSKVTGDDTDAWTRMKEITWYLQAKGFNVVREKIETVPWHPKAVVHDENSKEGYFEAHIPIKIDSENQRCKLEIASRPLDLHLSKNPFKINEDGSFIQMATFRQYSVHVDRFKQNLAMIISKLMRYEFVTTDKVDIEYALHDSNVSHDSQWVGQNSPSVLV